MGSRRRGLNTEIRPGLEVEERLKKKKSERGEEARTEAAAGKSSKNFWSSLKGANWQEAVTPSVLYPSAHRSPPPHPPSRTNIQSFHGESSWRWAGGCCCRSNTNTHMHSHTYARSHLRGPTEKHFLDRLQQAR